MTTGIIYKGPIGKEDFHMLDTEGYPTTTFNRVGDKGIATLYHTPNIYMTHLAMVNARYFNSGAMNTTTLQQALSYIGAASTVLYLEPGAWSVTSLTVPANVILKISWGAMITVSGTLTINGAVDAPPCQVFSGGTVTINSTGALWKNTWTGTTNGCLYLQNEGLAAEVNTFTDADATPSVKDGYIFKTANTAATVITSFDDGTTGQEITVYVGDGNTSFNFSSGNLRGYAGTTWSPSINNSIKAVYGGTYWYCITSAGADLSSFASATEELTGYESTKASSPSVSREMIINLKPTVNAAVNKLDIFTKSGGAVPSASNPIKVMIPDGNGYTQRTRAATYLSGTSQFIMADAANYWSKGSLDGEIKTAYIYAIWDGTGIVWALGGYSGFTRVPASTTATDDDFFLLEEGSTYTKAVTEYCVCVGKIRYQYDTADTPNHTIQATVLDAPQIIWNPKSDYNRTLYLPTTVTSAGDIADYSAVSIIVKQSGKYFVVGEAQVLGLSLQCKIKTGSATYSSASLVGFGNIGILTQSRQGLCVFATPFLNAGDTVHLGIFLNDSSGNRIIYGEDSSDYGLKSTGLIFFRMD
jgi:hypothetical protein